MAKEIWAKTAKIYCDNKTEPAQYVASWEDRTEELEPFYPIPMTMTQNIFWESFSTEQEYKTIRESRAKYMRARGIGEFEYHSGFDFSDINQLSNE